MSGMMPRRTTDDRPHRERMERQTRADPGQQPYTPADLDWTRDLPAWQAGPILAASVLRVVAGEGPVAGLLTRVSPAYALAAGYALDCGAFILTPLTNGAVARVEAP